jgi:hypothetical protein
MRPASSSRLRTPAGSPASGELQALDDRSRRLLTDQAEALEAEHEPAHGRGRGQPPAAPCPAPRALARMALRRLVGGEVPTGGLATGGLAHLRGLHQKGDLALDLVEGQVPGVIHIRVARVRSLVSSGSPVRLPPKLTAASLMMCPFLLPGRAVCPALGPGGRWTPRHAERPPEASAGGNEVGHESRLPAVAGSGAGLVGGVLVAGGRASHLPSSQIPPPWRGGRTRLPLLYW